MTIDFTSLAIISLVSALCPILVRLIPRNIIPETVLLITFGAVLGPNALGFIHTDTSIKFLSDLGLALLFLLAGYEIEPKKITGTMGKHALITWFVTLALAGGFVALIMLKTAIAPMEQIAVIITLTSTALGTLMPILKERGIMNTLVGDAVISYGTWGELAPILAMAILLSTRARWETILILIAFIAIAVLVAVIPKRIKHAGACLQTFFNRDGEKAHMVALRLTLLLLIGLTAISALFDLDIVLGAFAAGFCLRYVVPDGDKHLEESLDGLAFGFFIPLFFIVSGANIDLTAVFSRPVLLICFIIMLLLVRAAPIFMALSHFPETKHMSIHNRMTVSLYCTTALPLIVAVTSVAVAANAMPQSIADVLIAAGAITVFLMPFLASITYRVVDAHDGLDVTLGEEFKNLNRIDASAVIPREQFERKAEPVALPDRKASDKRNPSGHA